MDAQRVRAPNEEVAKYYADAELESIAKTLFVPTNDDDVRRRLRQIGEPAELGREDRADRRLRLRRILARRKADGIDGDESSEDSDDNEDLEEVWSEGPQGLKEARERIAAFVAPRTTTRLQNERQRWLKFTEDKPGFTSSELMQRRKENELMRKTALAGTQSGFARAVGSVASNGRFVVSGDWSGALTVIDMQNDMSVVARASPHKSANAGAAPTCVSWSKQIASGSADGSIALHDFSESQLETRLWLRGHQGRVSCTAFHPSDSYLISASHDESWRLWDLESASCLLEQRSHTMALNTVSIHEDGALVLSGGDDTVGRVLDIRSGRNVADLRGHARAVHASGWNVNKAVLGGADNMCIVWDLRNFARPLQEIPAHNALITGISIEGTQMATSSMDGSVRLWSCDTWRLQRTLQTPTRLLAVSAIENGWVAARWDRCVDWYTYDDRMLI